MTYIYHNLGLGDHILCNGLVRIITDTGRNFKLFVKRHNVSSVKFMFRDILNLELIEVDSDQQVVDYLVNNKISANSLKFTPNAEQELITGGISNFVGNAVQPWDIDKDITFDEYFYRQHDLDFKNRWDKFFVKRDLSREQELFMKLNPDSERYVLIHNAGSDGVNRINNNYINSDCKKIYVEKHTEIIFDYLTLISLAEEIHCVESSFLLLVDSFKMKNKKIFFHNNTLSRGFKFKLKNPWQIV